MNTTNSREQFSFDFGKMKFDSTNPGKQTKEHLIILLIFFLLLVGLVLGAILWLKINLACLTTPLIGKKVFSLASGLLSKWRVGRPPCGPITHSIH